MGDQENPVGAHPGGGDAPQAGALPRRDFLRGAGVAAVAVAAAALPSRTQAQPADEDIRHDNIIIALDGKVYHITRAELESGHADPDQHRGDRGTETFEVTEDMLNAPPIERDGSPHDNSLLRKILAVGAAVAVVPPEVPEDETDSRMSCYVVNLDVLNTRRTPWTPPPKEP